MYFALWFVSFVFFFSSPNLSGRRLDVYHTSNLECKSEMCCTRLAGNAGCISSEPRAIQDAKIAIFAPSHDFVGLYLRN